MKLNVVFLILVFIPITVGANENNIQMQMLDARIVGLERDIYKKYAELEKCEKETHGFKIAGVATLAATSVGVYANVKLKEKLSEVSKVGGVSVSKDDRSAEQISADNISELCLEFPDEPECKK